MHHMDADQVYEQTTWQQLHKNAASSIEQVLEAASHKTVRTPTNHLEKHPN